jgi:hypothetical protein
MTSWSPDFHTFTDLLQSDGSQASPQDDPSLMHRRSDVNSSLQSQALFPPVAPPAPEALHRHIIICTVRTHTHHLHMLHLQAQGAGLKVRTHHLRTLHLHTLHLHTLHLHMVHTHHLRTRHTRFQAPSLLSLKMKERERPNQSVQRDLTGRLQRRKNW